MKIYYCFHGDKYAEEAYQSISGLMERNEVDVKVCRPKEGVRDVPGVTVDFFEVEDAGCGGYGYKVKGIAKNSDRRYIFLDTDTKIVGGINDIWDATEYAGLVGVVDPLLDTFRHVPNLKRPKGWEYLGAMGELNSGVLGVNLDLLPKGFMEKWVEFHDELINENKNIKNYKVPDQPSLMRTMLFFNIYPLYIGSNYNYRPCYPQVLYDKVSIVHIHDDAYTAFNAGAGVNGDVVVTFPWGLSIVRSGILNKIFYAVHRMAKKLVFRFFGKT